VFQNVLIYILKTFSYAGPPARQATLLGIVRERKTDHISKIQLPPSGSRGPWPGVPAAAWRSDGACRRGVVMHVTTHRRHPGRHPTSSMPTLLTAFTWGIGNVTCRPHWGATPAEQRGNKHLGRLPMRNGSRPGKAQPCKSANSCIYNVCHTAPAYERPPFAETFCGIV
jgi:hypothetical protein